MKKIDRFDGYDNHYSLQARHKQIMEKLQVT